MPTFLVFILLSHIVTSSTVNSYCIWNHQGLKTVINGQYALDTTVTPQPSYVKKVAATCSFPVLYLWRNTAANAWQLSSSTTTNDYVMQCTKTNLAECSAGNWGTDFPNVYAQAGECPEWNCASITTTQTHKECNGPFDEKVAHNAWKHSGKDLYFFFAPHVFKWVCYNKLEQDTCPATAYVASAVSWTQLSGGETTDMSFMWMGTSGIESGTAQVICAAPDPTAKPTANPTTRSPTKNPTKKPTINPTKSPTKKPTLNPTKKPTISPTEKEATGNPTKKPTVSPTEKATIAPTKEGETREPTKSPISANVDAQQKEVDKGETIQFVGYKFDKTSLFWGICIGIFICSFFCCCILICQTICSQKEGRERVPDDEEMEMGARYR